MVSRGFAPLILAASFLSSSSFAATNSDLPRLDPRDDSTFNSTNSGSSSNDTQSILDPVIPPDVNQNDLSILNLDPQVTLAWAGAGTATAGNATTNTKRSLLRRDGSVFTQANFTFAYPVIPLDHSNYVSGVSCSGGMLSGTLSDKAYSFAKKLWTGAGDIVFVTAVDGCGLDSADDFFHSTSVTFSDSSKTFSAAGSSAPIQNVASHMNLKWGNIGTTNVKRSIDKTEMFESHLLYKRRTDWNLHWGAWLHSDDYLGEDFEAPWEFAAKLAEWGSEGGEADDSYKKGEVADPSGHHKRSSNMTELAERGLDERELSYGLRLYCVECGFGGTATIWGEVDVDFTWLPPFFELSTVQVGIEAGMKAGLNIGMQAFVKYEKEWEKELGRLYFENWGIPGICDVGPFVSVSVKATAGIEASGQLLVGAAVTWDGIDLMLDLLDPSNSHSNAVEPAFEHTAEAAGEVKVEAKLGLPIMLGAGVRLLGGLWKAEAGIVDTPSIVAEGKFEVSVEVGDDGEIEYDINGGCYGVAWDVHFENELDAALVITGLDIKPIPLIRPMESDPIAEGCIGYVVDGTDDDDSDNPQSKGSGTGTTGNGLSSGGNGLSGGSGGSKGSSSKSSLSSKSTATAQPVVKVQQLQVVSSSSTSSPIVVQATSKSSSTSTTTSKSTSTSTSSSTAKTTSSTSPAVQAQANKATSTSKSSSTSSTSTRMTTTTTTTAKATKATTTSTKTTCTPSTSVIAATATPTSITCKKAVKQASVSSTLNVGAATTVKSIDLCAASCFKNTKCLSFSYSDAKSCQLYSKAYKNLKVATKSGAPTLTFYDHDCYAYSTCPK